MENDWFKKMLSIQGELAIEYQKQKKIRRYEKQFEEKKRDKERKMLDKQQNKI